MRQSLNITNNHMDEKLQKFVSDCGLMSRRAAEREIEYGHFAINGIKAKLGDRVDPAKDRVTYKGEPLKRSGRKVYILLHKPTGVVTTMNDEFDRRTVAELVKGVGKRVYPVGRLDKDSEGLLLMTDDGTFANRIAHPSGNIRKVYHVMLAGRVENNQLDSLRAMRKLDDEPIMPVQVDLIERSDNASKVKFVLSEGKNRQIRRMCEAVGLSVMQLKRVQMGNLTLGGLESGAYRHLTDDERKGLLKLVSGEKQNGRNDVRAATRKTGANRKGTGKR